MLKSLVFHGQPKTALFLHIKVKSLNVGYWAEGQIPPPSYRLLLNYPVNFREQALEGAVLRVFVSYVKKGRDATTGTENETLGCKCDNEMKHGRDKRIRGWI